MTGRAGAAGVAVAAAVAGAIVDRMTWTERRCGRSGDTGNAGDAEQPEIDDDQPDIADLDQPTGAAA